MSDLPSPTDTEEDTDTCSDDEPATAVPTLWALCAARLRAKMQASQGSANAQGRVQEFVIHDLASDPGHDLEWGELFQANWRAAPPTPQAFNIGDANSDMDEDSDCAARDGHLETAAAGPYVNGATLGVSVPDPLQTSGDDEVANVLNDLEELLELAEAGEHVEWPAGWSEHSARAAIHARPVEAAPAKKPRIELQPEAERNGGSTPFIPRPKAVPIA